MVYSKGDRKGEILSPHLQIKAVEFLNSGLYKKESSTQAMEDKIKELEKENLQLKKDKAKLSSPTIQRTKKIQPNQFRCAAKSLFKEGKKEYTAEFIKLAIKISNMGHISIQTTVDCTKAVFEFLTGYTLTNWVHPSTLARWNKEIAALSLQENLPNQNIFQFFGYGIMADESTRCDR
ncbi:hypothetical protein RhiirA4_460525 [Rhizophagus irregularis]|uniref:Uncharacterized protein n=1 Tax=Rhizophagus irregularis TaxID=588596 RepID=A0A2I1GGU4_9GLOM|nr:hypothetical protein RhiirA4_460525 [Rhizophagus irregularis]